MEGGGADEVAAEGRRTDGTEFIRGAAIETLALHDEGIGSLRGRVGERHEGLHGRHKSELSPLLLRLHLASNLSNKDFNLCRQRK